MIKKLKKINAVNKKGTIFSSVYSVVDGGFDLDGINTYLGSSNVETLAKDIEIFEKLTQDRSWPVSMIIQRDVDKKRVKEIAKGFILKSQNTAKYFPPIIIALVPRLESGEISSKFDLEDTLTQDIATEIHKKGSFDDQLLSDFKDAKNLSNFPGLYVLDYWSGIAKYPLCWDIQKVYAIVIDGQHRLEALKLAKDEKPEVAGYKQDVVFLDLSKKAFEIGRSPVEAIRRIFIDINYNARPVTNARRTLMDDKDLSSLIVQSLVNDVETEGARSGKFLTPQLVDWHSENLKHSFPHITGVLVLQQLIEDNYLNGTNLVSIKDLRKTGKVNKFVKILNNRFLVDDRIKTKVVYQGIVSLQESYQVYTKIIEADVEEEGDFLFSMDYNVLNVARDSFNEFYASSMVKYFNEFFPYAKAIEILKDAGVFDSSNVLNRAIVKSSEQHSENEKQSIDTLRESMHSSLDDMYYLCYTVLGQKAFFRHYYKELLSYLSDKDIFETTILKFTEIWLERMNYVVSSLASHGLFRKDQVFKVDKVILKKRNVSDYGLIAESFWQGIIYNGQSIVYNNQGIEGLVGVLDFIYKSFPFKKDNGKIDFPSDDMWNKIPYSPNRVRSKVKLDDSELDSSEIESISNAIWLSKLDMIKKTIEKTEVNNS
jgi:DGQHR domain-containing protein